MPARRIAPYFIYLIASALACVLATTARAEEALAGQMQAQANGQTIQLPLLHSDISAKVEGDLATVTVVQTFENPTKTALNATYLFPLNEDSAVFAMTMQVGKETIAAKIRKREDARKDFEAAKSEGKAAALLEQQRPNMFTQDVANLMPGKPVKVTLTYAQTVPRVDGAYELVIPLVVGPRYNPAPKTAVASTEKAPVTTSNGWQIGPPPAYPGVFGLTLPAAIAQDRVSLAIDLKAAMPIANVTSATHALAITGDGAHKTIGFQAGRVIDNRDFVMRYTLAGNAVQAGALTHTDKRGGYFSLVLEPPQAPTARQITPREIVFVLDTSGSMDGEPIEASKTFMHKALETLGPNDYFRIVQFDSTPREYTAGPIAATPAAIGQAQSFITGLTAQGGTELDPAMQQAFSVPQQPNTLRIVVFLSDGYIGNEAEVLSHMSGMMGKARVYAFGVGTSVNRYLLSEMARRGHGFARYIDPTESPLAAAQALAQRLDAPVLTDIKINWGDLKPTDVTPAIMPDLFAGDSLRVMGRFAGARDATITVTGKVNGAPATLPVHVKLDETTSPNAQASAIPQIWARSQVGDLMREYTSPPEVRSFGLNENGLQDRVTKLGLDYALVTQWTSFVAVSNEVVNANPGSAQDASVPLPMVAGVGPGAYGIPNIGSMFSGSSAPEPDELLLLVALMLIAAFFVASHKRRPGTN